MLEIKVSLRIYSKGYTLNEISKEFKCKEDFGYSEGDNIGNNSNNTYSETMWGKKSSQASTDDIDQHVTELLDWLEPRKAEFQKLVVNSNVKSDFFCFLSSDNGQGGASISSSVLKRISAFDLDIAFDVYAEI